MFHESSLIDKNWRRRNKGKLVPIAPKGGFLKSDIQARYESGHPLVRACYFDDVARCHYHSRYRSAPRRLDLPKRGFGLWPEKVSTDANGEALMSRLYPDVGGKVLPNLGQTDGREGQA